MLYSYVFFHKWGFSFNAEVNWSFITSPYTTERRKKKKAQNHLGIDMLYVIAVAGSSSPDVSLFLSSTNVKYKQHSWFGSTPVGLEDELLAA